VDCSPCHHIRSYGLRRRRGYPDYNVESKTSLGESGHRVLMDKQGPYQRGIEWPMMVMAITASVLLALGLIPPYFELAKRNGRIVGISMTVPLLVMILR
jgi:hypothetical protein